MNRPLDALRQAYWNVRHWDARFLWRLVRTVSLPGCIACLWLFPVRRPGRRAVTRLTLRAGPQLSLRTYSSDPDVFRQVFIEAQYELPIRLSGVTRVVDAGANVGMSTLYFLLHYPEATVVALEPEESNHELCAANTRAFGDRCRLLRAALWSHPTCLSVTAGDAAWSTRVLETEEGHPSVEAMSLAQVMEHGGWDAIDIVKLDIEGAEENVLAAETTDTVSRGRCWAVEIHSDAARRAFDKLFGDSSWQTGRQGEIDFAWRTN